MKITTIPTQFANGPEPVSVQGAGVTEPVVLTPAIPIAYPVSMVATGASPNVLAPLSGSQDHSKAITSVSPTAGLSSPISEGAGFPLAPASGEMAPQ